MIMMIDAYDHDDGDSKDDNDSNNYNGSHVASTLYLGHYFYSYPEEIQNSRKNFGSKLFFYRTQLIHGK